MYHVYLVLKLIYVIKITINNNNVLLAGNYQPASFRNVWIPAPTSQPDCFLSSSYVSVLTDCQFFGNQNKDNDNSNEKYPILSEFAKYAAKNDNKLQIMFITSNYQGNDTFGTVYGVIGCYTKSHHFLNGMYLFGNHPCVMAPPKPPYLKFYDPFTGNTKGKNADPSQATPDLGVMTSHNAMAQFPVVIKYVKNDKKLFIDLSNYSCILRNFLNLSFNHVKTKILVILA